MGMTAEVHEDGIEGRWVAVSDRVTQHICCTMLQRV